MSCKYVYVPSFMKIEIPVFGLSALKALFENAELYKGMTREMSNAKIMVTKKYNGIKTEIQLENRNTNAPLRSVCILYCERHTIPIQFKFNVNTATDKPLCVTNTVMAKSFNDRKDRDAFALLMSGRDSMHFKNLLVEQVEMVKTRIKNENLENAENDIHISQQVSTKWLLMWADIFALIHVLFNVTTSVDRFARYTSLRSAHANVVVDDNAQIRKSGPLKIENIMYAQTRNAMYHGIEAFVYDIPDMLPALGHHLLKFNYMLKSPQLCKHFNIGNEKYYTKDDAQYLLILIDKDQLVAWSTFKMYFERDNTVTITVNYLCASGNRTGTIVLDLLKVLGCLNDEKFTLSLAALESAVSFYTGYGLVQKGLDDRYDLPFMTNSYNCQSGEIINIASRFKHISVHSDLSMSKSVTSFNSQKRKHIDLQFEEMKQNDFIHKPKKVKTMSRGFTRSLPNLFKSLLHDLNTLHQHLKSSS